MSVERFRTLFVRFLCLCGKSLLKVAAHGLPSWLLPGFVAQTFGVAIGIVFTHLAVAKIRQGEGAAARGAGDAVAGNHAAPLSCITLPAAAIVPCSTIYSAICSASAVR
jgi:hypothetical protein